MTIAVEDVPADHDVLRLRVAPGATGSTTFEVVVGLVDGGTVSFAALDHTGMALTDTRADDGPQETLDDVRIDLGAAGIDPAEVRSLSVGLTGSGALLVSTVSFQAA